MITPFAGKDVQPYAPTCLDIETAPDGTVIAVGFIWSDNDEQSHYTRFGSFREWYHYYSELVLRHKQDKALRTRLSRIYAHNGANFDWLSMYTFLADTEACEKGEYITADSAGIGMMLELKGIGKVSFMDSYRMLPSSLASLTKTFNVDNAKQEVPQECKHNYLLFKEKYPNLFWGYLESDVKGLQQVLYAFWNSIYTLFGNVGSLPMTLPSLVLRIFSKQLDHDMYTPAQRNLKELERTAYKGGLTLCMRTGVFDNVNVYDVNSMYPYAMVQHEYPASYLGYWTQEYEAQSMGLWRATFNQSRQDIPPILFDHTTGAAYSGCGVYSTNELNYLESIGGEFTITEGYVYIERGTLFNAFVSNLYAMRKEAQVKGDEALAFVLKIMMNSLYGKFAQREIGDTITLGSADLMVELLDKGIGFKIMGDWYVIEETRTVKHAFVAIAAMITANARIDLHTRMVRVIDSGYEVYYCDTDSIHTNGTFDTSNELGGIKLENNGNAAYAGKKIYAFEQGKVKAKGIGRNITAGTLDYDTIVLLATDKECKTAITFDTFPSVKSVLGKKREPAVIEGLTRNLRNTGGIWDNREDTT